MRKEIDEVIKGNMKINAEIMGISNINHKTTESKDQKTETMTKTADRSDKGEIIKADNPNKIIINKIIIAG